MNNLSMVTPEYNKNTLEAPHDVFDLPRKQSRYSIESTKGAAENPEIALTAQRIHGRCYVDFGYFTEEGLEPDGSLVPELDGTREDADGQYEVSYLIARTLKDNMPGATLRLIGVKDGGSVLELPTCKYGLSAEAQAQVEAASGGKGRVREIAALAVAGAGHGFGSYELMRAVMQSALINKSTSGLEEVYVASLTDTSLGPVATFTGEGATRIINDPVSIFSTDPRAKDIVVYPVLISPFLMVEDAVEQAHIGVQAGDMSAVKRLAFLMDGLTSEQMPEAARDALSAYTQQ